MLVSEHLWTSKGCSIHHSCPSTGAPKRRGFRWRKCRRVSPCPCSGGLHSLDTPKKQLEVGAFNIFKKLLTTPFGSNHRTWEWQWNLHTFLSRWLYTPIIIWQGDWILRDYIVVSTHQETHYSNCINMFHENINQPNLPVVESLYPPIFGNSTNPCNWVRNCGLLD